MSENDLGLDSLLLLLLFFLKEKADIKNAKTSENEMIKTLENPDA